MPTLDSNLANTPTTILSALESLNEKIAYLNQVNRTLETVLSVIIGPQPVTKEIGQQGADDPPQGYLNTQNKLLIRLYEQIQIYDHLVNTLQVATGMNK